jgi:hypothetical protein
MIEWGRDKARLARYRHGWGVACGLDVRVAAQNPGSVIVTPGYALGCCGDDIVVCETSAPFDLSSKCADSADPCLDLAPRTTRQSNAQRAEQPAATPLVPETIALDEQRYDNVSPVDLLIHYSEQQDDPRPAWGRNGCADMPECEYARTREWYHLSTRPASQTQAQEQARVQGWEKHYRRCLAILGQFGVALDGQSAADIHNYRGALARQALLNWLAEHRLAHFHFMEDRLHERTDPGDWATEPPLVHALFYIIMDCLHSWLAAECYSCREDTGVPLARIWLRRAPGTRQCTVLAIDASPPARRPIGPAELPAPDGKLNLAGLLWQRPLDARRVLSRLGIQASTRAVTLPGTAAALSGWFDIPYIESGAAAVDLSVLSTGGYGERVVGIRPRLPASAAGTGTGGSAVTPINTMPAGETH